MSLRFIRRSVPRTQPPAAAGARPPLVPRAPRTLFGTAAAAACVAATGCAPGPVVTPSGPEFVLVGDTLRQPYEVRSVNGVLDVGLTVQMHTFTVPHLNGDTLTYRDLALRSYRLSMEHGRAVDHRPAFPGPTFRIRPGDRVRIHLRNHLAPSEDDRSGQCMNYPGSNPPGGGAPVDSLPNCFHGPNSTNIHYHGFHVTPDSPGDNVLLQIPPGGEFQYDFRMPLNQSPGTHWYHPHKHGSVALQVVNGMAGALIVEDPHRGLDSLVLAMGMREHLIAIQQVDSALNLIGHSGSPGPLVNGQRAPVVVMRPGEVQRWRIVNENVELSTNYRLMFDTLARAVRPGMYDVARDGVQYAPGNYHPHVADTVLVTAPGNRLDVLVQAPVTPGVHRFLAVPHEGAQAQHHGARRRGAAAGDTLVVPTTALLIVQVVPEDGARYPRELPAALPPLPHFLANIDTAGIRTRAQVVFSDSVTNDRDSPSRFWLGSSQNPRMRFSDAVFIPRSAAGELMPMVVGETQVWEVQNRSTRINHPFHIHINPFQVLEVVFPDTTDRNAPLYRQLNAAAAAGNPIWLDVVPLPRADAAGNPGVVVIAQRYDRFEGCPDCGSPAGQFVMHCHILGHEERGMMQKLEIFNDRREAERRSGERHHGHHHH